MIPDEVVLLCGEWETGPTPRELSGESYNLILDVKEIIQHPDFEADGLGVEEGSDLGRALWKKNIQLEYMGILPLYNSQI